MTTIFIDLETYCETPITHGTHRYAETAEIMLAAWAIDDGPVEVVDHTPGLMSSYIPTLPDLIGEADAVVIHNSAFDCTVLRHAWGVDLPSYQIHDTMIGALAHALPGSLAKLCDILKVPFDHAKDKDGKRLINLFCKPRPKNQKLRRATRETHPEDWQKFIDYARLDIEAMRAVYKRLPRWNTVLDTERRLFQLDQKINNRGVAIDMDLVRSAITAVQAEKKSLDAEAQEMTNNALRSAAQRDALIQFIFDRYEIPLEDLKASTVEAMLTNDNYPEEIRDLLRNRLRVTTASTAKYKALERSTSSDSRLRGTLQIYGASRTGRWAGRLFQPQNLPRWPGGLKADEVEAYIAAMKAECISLVTSNAMDAASWSLRGAIIAPPGRKLVVSDLSNIEGRVLAWLAGEDWKLRAFTAYDEGRGPDLYKATAGKILGKPADDVSKDERQKVGKVSELALGYQGGVGAFVTFATAYAVDLEDLAVTAYATLPSWAIEQATSLYAFMKEHKRPMLGLGEKTWIGIDAIKQSWRDAHAATSSLWKRVEDAARAPVLVAYHFRSDLARLLKAFPRARELDQDPQTIRDWNAGKIRMLLAHPASAGHGLNLQDGGNILAVFGHWWDLEQYMQIVERIGPVRQKQAGHDRPVFIYHIVARGTVDDLVCERRQSKRSVQDILLERMKHEQMGNS